MQGGAGEAGGGPGACLPEQRLLCPTSVYLLKCRRHSEGPGPAGEKGGAFLLCGTAVCLWNSRHLVTSLFLGLLLWKRGCYKVQTQRHPARAEWREAPGAPSLCPALERTWPFLDALCFKPHLPCDLG